MTNAAPEVPTLSIVVPVYNERENVCELLRRIESSVAPLGLTYEIIFSNDGSRDGTAELLESLRAAHSGLRTVHLSRNFGHQAAIVAGLSAARGELVVTLDGDLQHPPELIPEMVRRWRDGADIVQTVRREPADANALKRAASRGFYRLLSMVSRIAVTPGAADFRLMSREAVDAFLRCGERSRFNRGLVQWIGFHCVELPYDAAPRAAGRSKYSWRSMLRLAGDAIFSFSSWPLRLAGVVGGVVSLGALAYLLFAIYARLAGWKTVPGWTSTLASVLILGGLQLIVLWILGEYVGRLYEEVKQRPIYIVRQGPPRKPARGSDDAQEQ